MPRDGLCLVVGAGLFLASVAAVPAGPPDDSRGRIESVLAVQRALQQGRDCLQRGNYQAAVYVLESEVARINGDRDYLLALRDAYRGYVRELTQAGRAEDLRLYQSRLQSIDPGSRFDLPAAAGQPKPRQDLGAAATPAPAPQTTVLPARPGQRGGLTARGAPPEDHGAAAEDPFGDANRTPSAGGGIATQAAEQFAKGQYAAAGRLYEQASHADPGSAGGFREQWAYCKLYGVVETLNRTPGRPPAELSGEVRQALALTSAPKLEAFGKDLLRRIQERSAGGGAAPRPVEVRHTPAQGGGWAVAETANFRVLHRQSREAAEEVARVAEETRTAMSMKWFGDDPPAWTPPCDVWLHATAEDYARETRAPRWSPGHSTIHREGERVTVRRIDLRCDIPHLTDAVLPHETTHQVLCGRFGRHDVPRWADEGMAVLTEPRERVELHLRNLPVHRQEHTLFPVGQLVKMANYPDARSVGPFYAGSVSLVEFLSGQSGGPRAFTAFLRDGLDQGYESALKRHYGIESFAELQQRWEQHAFGSATAQLSPPGR